MKTQMHTARAICMTLALAGMTACRASDGMDPFVKHTAAPTQHLSSLDVVLSFDPLGAGCVTLDNNGQLPAPSVTGDYCPPNAGTPSEPLAYQTGRRVRVFANITAIGSDGAYPFPVTGNLPLTLTNGQIFSGTPTRLEQGVVAGQRLQFLNAPGRVQVWAEASTLLRLDGQDLAPTFSLGSSDAMIFSGPTVADVQRTDNDAISVLDGQRVDVRAGNLVITRVAGNGFTVQDLSLPNENGLPRWNAMFVFAFNGVDNVRPGSRLLRLKGAITSFQGMTQMAEPEYITAGSACAPKQAASRFGTEPQETEEGGFAIRARCPLDAECVDDACVPANNTVHYDRFGRVTCQTVTTCGGAASTECPAGMACDGRSDWVSTDQNGQPAHTCQPCPQPVGGELWTTPGQAPGWCGPIYKGDTYLAEKLRNESLEAVLVELRDVTVDGLDLSNDFFRSGFESFGQWKVKLPDGACATITSENYPSFNVVEANTNKLRLSRLIGTIRQVRFTTGSAFWMVDLRHKDDMVVAPGQ